MTKEKGKARTGSALYTTSELGISYIIGFSAPGVSPPPPPRALFGRDELIEKIVGLVDTLTPIALVGAGGIGKTSIALSLLHHDRVKKRFGDNRRFIRCDQFPASRVHFLSRLSAAIGAGVQNHEDLSPLRPLLSSKEMLIVLDNAEAILDPQGASAEEIYALVEELSQFNNICLCITSRISTIPPDCETLDVPTLSIEAARDTFYGIYKNGERPDLVDDILQLLDFHPLSITLLATVARHNKWDAVRLTREWERRRTAVLHTHYNKSLAATIELSLASPMFQELGPDARELLGVIAFFPQGIDENNLDWLFPTIPNRTNIFDRFCILSLTHRGGGFVTMLAPLRDYLRPKTPRSSLLLRDVKQRYSNRLSVETNPGKPGFEETRWIASEDVNVEHLLDVFTPAEENSTDVWDTCANFMEHLYWHKPRPIVLGPKIRGLPDGHPSKPRCLFQLSRSVDFVGNHAESKQLLTHTLKLWREWGNDRQVARTLSTLASVNRHLGLHKEGIPQVKEALEIYERLGDTAGRVESLQSLAMAFADSDQDDAAEEAASHAINLSSNGSGQSRACWHHHILSHICRSRGETEAAIGHLETALRISSSPNPQDEQIRILRCLVLQLIEGGRFEDARIHAERLEPYTVNDPLSLGLVVLTRVCVWYGQGRFEEVKSEVSRTIGVYEKMGVSVDFLERCKGFLRTVEEGIDELVASGESYGDGKHSTSHVHRRFVFKAGRQIRIIPSFTSS